MNDERITIFAGHYGSGKTNLAVNYAIHLREKYPRVAIADLDIVNPYFRTNDSEKLLRDKDIRVISSEYAGTNLEAPAVPGGVVSIFDEKHCYGVIDLGGDDRGAYALGRYAEKLEAEASKNVLLVINRYRPLSQTPREVAEIKNEIEQAARISFTGIVNNSNLGASTTADDVLASLIYAEETAEITGLPLVMTAVRCDLEDELRGKIPNIYGLRIISVDKWRIYYDKS